MKPLNRKHYPGRSHPTKILQFGEGNFLRAFVDWQIDLLNEHSDLNAGITILRPIDSDFPPSLNEQDGLYTTIIRGLDEQGKEVSQTRLIRSVNREISIYRAFEDFLATARDPAIELIFSNTTEAGIAFVETDALMDAPAVSFPAKLTRWLWERFQHFHGSKESGVMILPCELIDDNGGQLRTIVLRYVELWQLPAAFAAWINAHVPFCSTLVDRIVTGYPKEEATTLQQQLGYHDQLMDAAEYFYLFVIQAPAELAQKLRLDQYPLNIQLVEDIRPYKERKVAILNGAHTALVPVAYLAGLRTVGEAMNDPQIAAFLQQTIQQEIIPVLHLPRAELEQFAASVIQRFQNPYIRHQLQAIALNSMSKYKTRILPQLLATQAKNQTLPVGLTFALAALLVFYRGEWQGEAIPVMDDAFWLERFAKLWSDHQRGELSTTAIAQCILSETAHWGTDLSAIPALAETVGQYMDSILQHGMRNALAQYLPST